MPELHFKINDSLFIKDPQGSNFGKRLLQNSILLFNEIGFEAFTFKKLAEKMGSAEASIYRYFENKHKLLLFLTNWYWEWVAYSIKINTLNLKDPKLILEITIKQIVSATVENIETDYINENILHQVIIKESTKAYHINNVDQENKQGFFSSYKELVKDISNIILSVNPDFKYPKSMASNLLEMANNQVFFAEHLPRLTDIKNNKSKEDQLLELLNYFVKKLLNI